MFRSFVIQDPHSREVCGGPRVHCSWVSGEALLRGYFTEEVVKMLAEEEVRLGAAAKEMGVERLP